MEDINTNCNDIGDESYLHNIPKNNSHDFNNMPGSEGAPLHRSKKSTNELHQIISYNDSINKDYLLSSANETNSLLIDKLENVNDVQICDKSVQKDDRGYKNSYEDEVSSMNATCNDITIKDMNNYKNNNSCAMNNTEKNTFNNIEELQNVESYGSEDSLRDSFHEELYSIQRDEIKLIRNKCLTNENEISADNMKKSECGYINSMLTSPNRGIETLKTMQSSLSYLNLFDLEHPKLNKSSGFKCTFNNPGFEIEKTENKADSFCSERNANVIDLNCSIQSLQFSSGENEISNMIHTSYDGVEKHNIYQNTDRENSKIDIGLTKQKYNSIYSYNSNTFPQNASSPEFIDNSVSSSFNIPHKILHESKCEKENDFQPNVNKQCFKIINNSHTREKLVPKNDVNENFEKKKSCTDSLSKNEIVTYVEHKTMVNGNRNTMEYEVRVDEKMSFVNESFTEYNSTFPDHNNNDENNCSFENMYLNLEDSKYDAKDNLVSFDNLLIGKNENYSDDLSLQELRSFSGLNTTDGTQINFMQKSLFGNIFYNENTLTCPDDVALPLEENTLPLIDTEMSSFVNLRSPVVSSVRMNESYNSPPRYNFSPVASAVENNVVWSTHSPIPSCSSLFSPFQENDSLVEDCLQTPDSNNLADCFDKNRSMDSMEHLLDEYLASLNDSLKEKPSHELHKNENKFEKKLLDRDSMSTENVLGDFADDQKFSELETIYESNFVEIDNLRLLNNKTKNISKNISTNKETFTNSNGTTLDSIKIGKTMKTINEKENTHRKSSCEVSNTDASNVKICKALNETEIDLDFIVQTLLLENNKAIKSNCVRDIHTNDFEKKVSKLVCGKDTSQEESVLKNGCNRLGIMPLNKTTKVSLISPRHPVFIKPNISNRFNKIDKSIAQKCSNSKEHSSSTHSSIHHLKKHTVNQFKKSNSLLKKFPLSSYLKKIKGNTTSNQNYKIKRLSKENLASNRIEKIVLSTGSLNSKKKNSYECFHTHSHKIICSSQEKTKCHIRLAGKPIRCFLEGRVVENVKSCKLRALKFINGSDQRFHIQDGSGGWPEREEFYPNSFGFPIKNTLTNIENTFLNPRPNPKLPLPQLSSFLSQYAKKKKSRQLTGGCVSISSKTQNMPKAIVYPVGKTGISITIPTGIVSRNNIMPYNDSISTSTQSKKFNVDTQNTLHGGKSSKLFCKFKKTALGDVSKTILQQSKPVPNKQYAVRVNQPLILPKFEAFTQPPPVLRSVNPNTTVNVPLSVHNVALQSSNIFELENSQNLVIQSSSIKSPISICQVSLPQNIPNNSLCLMVPTNLGYKLPNYVLDRNVKYTLRNKTHDSSIIGKKTSSKDIPTKILPNPGILGNLTPVGSIFQETVLNRTEQNCASSPSLRIFDCQEKKKQIPITFKTNDYKTENQYNEIRLVQNNTNKIAVDLASTSNIVQHLRRKIFKRKPYPDSIKHKVRDLLRDDLRHRFPGISDRILEQLCIPPQVLHRGYFSVRDLKIIQNQILSVQLNSIFREHVIVCIIQNCQLCLKYEKQKKALLLAEKEQRLGTRLLNNSRRLNISKDRGRGRGKNIKGFGAEFDSSKTDPIYKTPIGSEKRKVSGHQYIEYFDKKKKIREKRRLHYENKPTKIIHKPNCSMQIVKQSMKRSRSESNVSDASIKVTCFGSCDDSCIKIDSCRICIFCSKDYTYTEGYNDSAKNISLINFIKDILKESGPSCVKKTEFILEKNELCIKKYKENLELKAKIDKEFPPFSESDDLEPSQKGVSRNLPRPLYLDLHSLQVGSNNLSADYQQQLIPKLRIIYSARKFVYELKLHDGGNDQHNNQDLPMLLVIDVPFKTVRALSIAANKVQVCVDTVPWVGVLGRRRACRVVMPNPLMTESQKKCVTLIKGALAIHPVHKLILPDHGRALAMYNGLTGVFTWFDQALKRPFPVLEAINPTWSLKSQLDLDHIVENQLKLEGYSLKKVSCGENKNMDLNSKEILNIDHQKIQKKMMHEEFITISSSPLINFSGEKNDSLIVYNMEKNHLTKRKIESNKREPENASNNCTINPDKVISCGDQVRNIEINSSLPGTLSIPSTVSSSENSNISLGKNKKEIIDHNNNSRNFDNDVSKILSSKHIQSSSKIEENDVIYSNENNVMQSLKCSRYFGAISEELAKVITEKDEPITSNMLSQAVKAVILTQVHSSSGMHLPTLLPQSCNCCEATCRSMTCPCARAGALCHTGARCGCKDCVNPLNVLSVLNININASRMDECLMQNLYNFNMLGLCEVLLKVIPLPCCGRSLEVRLLLPGTVLCLHCGCALSFSWCLGWPSLQAVSPRNHCLVCCSCQPPLYTHCQMCGQCTRSTALGGCTTCGTPKLFGL